MASLSAKRRLFLEEYRWRTVPWALEPASKRPQAHLLDILVMIPGLLEDEKRLLVSDENCEEEERQHEEDVYHRCPAAGEPLGISPPEWLVSSDRRLVCRRVTLCNNIAAQLEKLYRWRWNWQHQNGRHVTVSPARWQPSDPAWNVLGGGKREGRLLNRLVFDSPTHANDIMLYNAALIWLMALLWKVDPVGAAGVVEGCAKRARMNRSPSYHPHPHSHSHSRDCHFRQQQYRHQNQNQHRIHQQPSPTLETPPFSEPGDTKAGAQACPCTCPCPSPSPLPSPDPSSPTLSFEPLSRPGDTASIRDPAIEICRVYDWQAQHHHRNPSPSSASSSGEDQICLYLFPMGIARGVLEADLDPDDRHQDARDWVRDMLGSSPVTRDYFGAGSNVAGFPSYITRRALYPDGEEADADDMEVASAEEGMLTTCDSGDDVSCGRSAINTTNTITTISTPIPTTTSTSRHVLYPGGVGVVATGYPNLT